MSGGAPAEDRARDAAAAEQPRDVAVDTAEPQGWRRWAVEIGHYDKDRLAGFGGFIAAGFLLGVVCIYVFVWLADEVMARATTALDARAYASIHQVSSPAIDALMRDISVMGSEAVWVLGLALLALFLAQRRWGAAALLVLVTVGVQMANDVLKTVVHRSRPEPIVGLITAQQWSFPSGHAMVSVAFYAYLGYLVWRLLTGVWRIALPVAFTLLVLAIGISRIYLQAHYLTDVIAGYLAGLVWTLMVIIGSQLLTIRGLPRLRRRPPSAGRRIPWSGEAAGPDHSRRMGRL